MFGPGTKVAARPPRIMPHTPSMAPRGNEPKPYEVLLNLLTQFVDEAQAVGDMNPRCLNVCANGLSISLKAARILKDEKSVDSAEVWRNKLSEFAKVIGTEESSYNDQIRGADRQIQKMRESLGRAENAATETR